MHWNSKFQKKYTTSKKFITNANFNTKLKLKQIWNLTSSIEKFYRKKFTRAETKQQKKSLN